MPRIRKEEGGPATTMHELHFDEERERETETEFLGYGTFYPVPSRVYR